MQAADGLLLGRRTYEGFAAAWPNIDDEEGFAAKMNSMAKYRVSSTIGDEQATWHNTTVIRGDMVAAVSELRERVATVGDGVLTVTYHPAGG